MANNSSNSGSVSKSPPSQPPSPAVVSTKWYHNCHVRPFRNDPDWEALGLPRPDESSTTTPDVLKFAYAWTIHDPIMLQTAQKISSPDFKFAETDWHLTFERSSPTSSGGFRYLIGAQLKDATTRRVAIIGSVSLLDSAGHAFDPELRNIVPPTSDFREGHNWQVLATGSTTRLPDTMIILCVLYARKPEHPPLRKEVSGSPGSPSSPKSRTEP